MLSILFQQTPPSPLALLAATCSKIGSTSMQQPQAVSQEETQEGNLAASQEQQFTLPSGQQIRIVNSNLIQQLQAAQQQALHHQQQTLQQQSVQQQHHLQQQQIVESNAMVAVNPKREPCSPPASPQTSVNAQTQLVTLQQLQSFLPQHMLANAATSQPSLPDGTQHVSRDIKPSLVSLQNIPGQFIQVRRQMGLVWPF